MSHGLRVTFSVGAVAQRGSSFAGSSSLVAAPQQAGGSGVRSVTCMAKKGKDVRLMITLECTEQKATGVGGISRYTSEKARGAARGAASA